MNGGFLPAPVRFWSRLVEYRARLVETRGDLTRAMTLLEPGRYVVWPGVAARNDPASRDFASRLLKRRSAAGRFMRAVVSRLLDPRWAPTSVRLGGVQASRLGGVFRGTVLFPARRGALKVFDLEHRRVLSLYPTDEAYQRALDEPLGRPALPEGLCVPAVYDSDRDGLWIIEEMIDFIPPVAWSPDMKTAVVDSILGGATTARLESLRDETPPGFQEKMRAVLSHPPAEALARRCAALLAAMPSTGNLPIARCHGDICFKNILVTNEQTFVIDWEHAGDYVFYFDAFNWFTVEALDSNDEGDLRAFARGDFDTALAGLWRRCGDDYSPDQKAAYLARFLLERLSSRDLDKSGRELGRVCERYGELLTVVAEGSR